MRAGGDVQHGGCRMRLATMRAGTRASVSTAVLWCGAGTGQRKDLRGRGERARGRAWRCGFGGCAPAEGVAWCCRNVTRALLGGPLLSRVDTPVLVLAGLPGG